MAAEPPERWFILRRRVFVQDGANALVDPDLGLKLPLDPPPPRTTRLTALTEAGVDRGQLSIVAKSDADLLLHELGRPTETDNPNIFFVALDAARADFMSDVRAAAAGRRVLDVTATHVLDRLPELPGFSADRNVGFLSISDDDNAKYAVAELQANNLHEADNAVVTVPFITFRHGRPNEPDSWDLADLHWPVVGDEANPEWTTHDVIAHDKKLWWVNLSRGLVACDPLPVEDLQPTLEFVALPVLAGFEDRHEPPEHIDRYRIVGVSAGGMRFVDVARRRNDPEAQTRVVVWTLEYLPQLMNQARWEDPRQTTLVNIWSSANYGPQMPRDKVPVVALVHPNEPAVVYFFLDQYAFSVDVNQSAVVDCAVMPGEEVDGVPRPINQRDVLAWKRPHFKVGSYTGIRKKSQKSSNRMRRIRKKSSNRMRKKSSNRMRILLKDECTHEVVTK